MAINTDYSNSGIYINNQLRDDTPVVKEDSLGKDAFLTMMVAQLKNQDPLSPMDGTDFTAQLAQFSSLEQQITTNTNLSSILASLNATSENSNIFDFIGKEITSDGNPVTVDNGDVIAGGLFVLDEPATINVTIYNSDGTAIRQMNSGNELIEDGIYNIEWDGRDNAGYTAVDGEYSYKVIALNDKGEYSTVSTATSGLVSGITSYFGKSYLMVDGRRVDPSSVETISTPKESL